ncbi:hypothetical protein KB206_00370 [Microvirga sp. STS02]|nr:hypothetical protein [Microvirga sp. STS02]MBR7207051.1 hypothetical protein [Microvirga sp. STS02]
MAAAPEPHYESEETPINYAVSDALPEAEDRHPEYEEEFNQEELPAVPVVRIAGPAATFAYELGYQVLPEPKAAPRTIIWRGQLKERLPETGLVHRVNVYRLNDGFWDCYREDELQAA